MLLFLKKQILVLFILLACHTEAALEETLHIVYPEVPSSESEIPIPVRYIEKLLILALDKSGYHYELETVSSGAISENRSHNYLIAQRYNVHWMMTSKAHEEALIPIRIPLYKGLIGWRIFLTRHADLAKFSAITDEGTLKALHAGMAHDWPDTAILKYNGFSVVDMYASEGWYNFLNRGRCDYFSRSVIEIWDDLPQAHEANIALETTLALHYPAAYYFFVAPGEEKIAHAIESGLTNAIRSGDFDRVFNEQFQPIIERSNLKNRRVIEISNPLFENSDVLKNETLWFDPSTY